MDIDEFILEYEMVVSSVTVSRLREMVLNTVIPVKKSNTLFIAYAAKCEPKKNKNIVLTLNNSSKPNR